ncbi:hypothetical protein DFJ77DRAFT_274690 [Powellomyces hirtus]|nr:hypothetical protein DFJ77DRAFT_274690 [Powellomyces hirtus]
MSNKLDRPMQGGENSDFSRVNMNASIHQHVSPISTTPIKRRERAGTPLESPTFASGHWDTSSDANFTYFAHSVREKSPVGTDAVTQRGLPHSGAQLESSSVDETAKPRTRVESLNNSSHSLERLANIEDEMEKYKELLEALKADEKEVMSLETTEQDVDDVVEASLTEEKAAELPEPEDGAGDIEDSYENSFIASNFSNLMSVATESPIDVILQRNRRQAQRVEMLAHTSTSVDRLLTSPSDQQFYEANFGIHGRLKATIVKKISRRLLNNAKKRTALKEQYVVKLGEWRREIDLAEQEGAKKKRKLGKAAATANSAVNAAYATPAAAPTRGSRRTTFTSDTVKTEAEFQEALAMLGNVDDDPTNHDPAKSAIEPAMIIDPILRKLTQYQDFSNYVVDPAGDMDRYNARLELVWSKAEVDLFKEKMLQYGKNFHAIAGDLPHKTTKDCVQFYYRGKYPLQLKTAVSKPPRRGKGQATAPKRKDVPEPRERPEAEEEATQGKETTTGRNRRGRGKEQGTSRKDDSVRRQPRVRLREEAVDREEREDEDMDKEGVESSSELPGSAVTRVEPSEGDAQPASDARITENEMADATEHTEKLQTRKLMESRRQSVVVESLENETSQVESTNVPSLKTAPPTETDNLPNTVGEEDPPSLRVDTTDYGPSQAVEVSTADGADIHTDGRQRKRGGRRKDAEELASADVAEGEPGGSNIDSFRSSPQPKRTISYWNSEETIAFRDAYASFGKDWELVAQRVGSKSAKQAQNYYKRNQMEMDLIRLSDTRLRTVSGDRRPYSPPDSESRLFSASHSSEGPRSVLHPPVLIHFEHKEEALVRRPSRLSVLLNGSDGVGSEASLRMDNSTNNSKQHFDPGINLSLQSELAPHRLLDHPSLLTHNSRVSPLQAASAVAALRVTKLGQSRINSQVETFIRKQSATASSTSPDSSKPGFQPISRSFRTPGYPTSTGLLLHDA